MDLPITEPLVIEPRKSLKTQRTSPKSGLKPHTPTSKTRTKSVNSGGRKAKGTTSNGKGSPNEGRVAAETVKETRSEIVVGVDFGTTYSGVAFAVGANVDTSGVQIIRDWPAGARRIDMMDKVPSRIVYVSENAGLLKDVWGYAVKPGMKCYSWSKLLLDKNARKEEFDDGFLLDGSKEGRMELPFGKTAVDVVTDFLMGLYSHTMAKFTRIIGEQSLKETKITYIVTHPKTWSDEATQKTKEAARGAGFRCREEDSLFLMAEPEAAAVAVLTGDIERQGDLYQVGSYVLIIDMGGGTTDLSTLRIQRLSPLRLEEAVPGIGGKYGSTTIDRCLYELLETEFGSNFTELPYSKTGPGSKFMEDWEVVKMNFDGSDLDEVFSLPLPCLEKKLQEQGIQSSKFDLDDGEVLVKGSDLANMFDKVLRNAIKLLEQQRGSLSKMHDEIVDAIVLCGGLGNSRYVWNRLNCYCKDRLGGRVALRTDPEAWSAIARGATIRGLEGNVVVSRKAPQHYGIGCCREFVEGENGEELKRTSGYFLPFMKRGQELSKAIKNPIKVHAEILPDEDNNVRRWALYASRQRSVPKRIDDDGVQEIGTIKIDLNEVAPKSPKKKKAKRDIDASSGVLIPIKISLHFGAQQEMLQVTAKCGRKELGSSEIEYGVSASRAAAQSGEVL